MPSNCHFLITKTVSFSTSFYLKVFLRKCTTHLDLKGQFDFIFCNNTTIQEINRSFLNHDYTTDILTFELGTLANPHSELYLSVEQIRSQSLDYNMTFEDELKFTIIHGFLHIKGYDDDTPKKRKQMHALQTAILQTVS